MSRALQRGGSVPWLGWAFSRGFRIGTSFGGIAQRLDDMGGQPFLNISMPRYGLGHSCDRIAVPVVLAAMSH